MYRLGCSGEFGDDGGVLESEHCLPCIAFLLPCDEVIVERVRLEVGGELRREERIRAREEGGEGRRKRRKEREEEGDGGKEEESVRQSIVLSSKISSRK